MRRALQIFLFVMCCGAITSCSPPLEPLRVGVLMWPPWELAFLARENGHIDPRRIEVIDYQTPAELVRAYRFGLIDAVFVASQFAIANSNELVDSRIIYVVDFSSGGDALIAAPHIDSIEDLEGKRIGVEAGPLAIYVMERAFEGHGLSRNDIEIVYVDTQDQKFAIENGEVDAVSTYDPTRTHLLAAGANELFSSRDMPLEIVDVLIASPGVIESKRKLLGEFLRGFEAARLDYVTDPEKAAAFMAIRENLLVPDFILSMEGLTLLSLEDNGALLTGKDPRLVHGLQKQVSVMKDIGLIREAPEVETLIDSSIVEEALH